MCISLNLSKTVVAGLLLCAVVLGQTQYIGPGKTTATCIDRDGDGYGVGTSCTGPDADDTDATVQTAAQGITKYGTLLAFIQHLGYNPTRIWYFDIVNGSDSNSCVVSASSFDPTTTPRCQHYMQGSQVVAGNAGLGGFSPGDLFLFRAGTIQQLKFDTRMLCTALAPCTFLAYPGETVLLDAKINSNGDGMTMAGGYAAGLCMSVYPCTLTYSQYSAVQDASYVTADGFSITDSAGYLGQGMSGYGGDHITARHIHQYGQTRGSFFNDAMSNLTVEYSVFHDNNGGHCSYWGSEYAPPLNIVFQHNIVYNCGLPNFQMNGRAYGMTVDDNVIWGDIGSGVEGITLMQGGGTAPGYTSYIRNNLIFGMCSSPIGIIDYPDVVSSGVFQWPINNLIIANNTFIVPSLCSYNGQPNGTSPVIFMSTEGLSEVIAPSSPYYYGGADITTGVVIRNNVLVSEISSVGLAPFIELHTRSSTYGGYDSGMYGPVTGDPNAPDNVNFIAYGIKDPTVAAANMVIQNNYFYAPNYSTTTFLEANNCEAGPSSTCTNSGGAMLPTGYTSLSSIKATYSASGLVSLNASNTGNVTSNANPLFTHDVGTDPYSPAPYKYSYVPLLASPLLGAGTTGTGNPTIDLIGTTRPSPPSIGAYQANPVQIPASTFSGQTIRSGQTVSQ